MALLPFALSHLACSTPKTAEVARGKMTRNRSRFASLRSCIIRNLEHLGLSSVHLTGGGCASIFHFSSGFCSADHHRHHTTHRYRQRASLSVAHNHHDR